MVTMSWCIELFKSSGAGAGAMEGARIFGCRDGVGRGACIGGARGAAGIVEDICWTGGIGGGREGAVGPAAI